MSHEACPVKGCDLPDQHDFVRVSKDAKTLLHLGDPDPADAPVVCWLEPGDLGYLIDALMDAADKRRARDGRIHARIADHLDDLALRLDDMRPAGIVRRPS